MRNVTTRPESHDLSPGRAALTHSHRQQFGAGAAGGAPSRAPEMGPAQYVKLLRETGIITGKDFTAVQAELIYAKVKPQVRACVKSV